MATLSLLVGILLQFSPAHADTKDSIPLPVANPLRAAQEILSLADLPERNSVRTGAPQTAETATAPEGPSMTLGAMPPPKEVEAAGAEQPEPVPLPEKLRRWEAGAADFDKLPPVYQALTPLMALSISQGDLDSTGKAIQLIYNDDFAGALALRKTISDKAARKLVYWYYLKRADILADPMEVENFRIANPLWPEQDRLRAQSEKGLLLRDADIRTIAMFFRKSKPQTGAGKAALALMYREAGQTDKARALVRDAWHNEVMGPTVEEKILKIFPDFLQNADHKRRADHYVFKDKRRWLNAAKRALERISVPTKATKTTGKNPAAKNQTPDVKSASKPKKNKKSAGRKTKRKKKTAKKIQSLKAKELRKLKARAAVVKRSRRAGKLLKSLPKSAMSDIGVYFNRIQWLRRKKEYDEAWKLLTDAHRKWKTRIEPEEWWVERRIHARIAVNKGKPETAYAIASNHGPLEGRYLREAEFLSGWISLRFLNKPDRALGHFRKMRDAASRGRHIARAEYWLGRTTGRLNRTADARAHYAKAAQFSRSYYGQLAIQALNPSGGRLAQPDQPVFDPASAARFAGLDAVRALIIAYRSGQAGLLPLFFEHLAWTLETPQEVALLSELAGLIATTRRSVRIGKVGIYRGLNVEEQAYPIDVLPPHKKLTKNVDEAFVLALARQESEFNGRAKSPVGARGMLQIMPRTARAIAKIHNVKYNRNKLTAEPSYNVMLGVAHLRDLLDDYDGSYILTLVAYNAGPNRVRTWTEEFGDPRDVDVNPVDWVERIPFTETRNYVKRILASAQIFRARLDGSRDVRLVQDLNRGSNSLGLGADQAASTGSSTSR